MSQTIRPSIPKPHYQCQGIEFGAAASAEIHFRQDNGGYHPAENLYYATLLEEETATESAGFFCKECLESFQEWRENRQSLRQFICNMLEDHQDQYLHDLLGKMHWD